MLFQHFSIKDPVGHDEDDEVQAEPSAADLQPCHLIL